jgi:hypothetical protein
MTSVKRDGLAILGAAKAKLGMATMDIIDIRCGHAELNLQKEVERMMNPINGPKELPTLLLYDEKGLQLFEDVCLKGTAAYRAVVLTHFGLPPPDHIPR